MGRLTNIDLEMSILGGLLQFDDLADEISELTLPQIQIWAVTQNPVGRDFCAFLYFVQLPRNAEPVSGR